MLRFIPLSALLISGPLLLSASVDPGLLNLLPQNAKTVSSIDVTRARSSEFGQYMLSRMHNPDRDFEDFIQASGFDPRRDLQVVVFAQPEPGSGNPGDHFTVLARGTFDPERIKTAVIAKGGTVEAFRGTDVLHPHSNGGHDPAIAFPEVGIAIMADPATLHQILANRATPTQLAPELQRQIDKISAENDAWFVSLTGGRFLSNHIKEETDEPAQGVQALESITQSSGGILFGDTVRLSFDAVTRSPQDATSFADVVRFFTSMVQMQRDKGPRAGIVASSLDTMDVTVAGSSVHVSLSMPEKSLEQLAQLGPPQAELHARRQH